MIKLDKEEKDLVKSLERGEWRSVPNLEKEKKRFQEYARANFRKTKRVNIRVTPHDLESLQVKAIQEGIPYQTLLSSVLHKYLSGRLKEVA
jgi:predicted DNA binding CopG/RHH family protein